MKAPITKKKDDLKRYMMTILKATGGEPIHHRDLFRLLHPDSALIREKKKIPTSYALLKWLRKEGLVIKVGSGLYQINPQVLASCIITTPEIYKKLQDRRVLYVLKKMLEGMTKEQALEQLKKRDKIAARNAARRKERGRKPLNRLSREEFRALANESIKEPLTLPNILIPVLRRENEYEKSTVRAHKSREKIAGDKVQGPEQQSHNEPRRSRDV
jgi:hypothetical protein